MFKLFTQFRFFEGAPREEHKANIESLVALFRLPIEDELCARPDPALALIERPESAMPATAQPQLARARS
jgi:hypothetical protein